MGMEMNPISGDEFEKYVREAETGQGTWVGAGAEELGLAGKPADAETMRAVFSDDFDGELPNQDEQPERPDPEDVPEQNQWWDRVKGFFTGGTER